MKTTIKKYLSYFLGATFALSISSCEDWLTLYPQDRVVEENFWEDKNDLLGVRYAAYQQMQNTLDKLVIWGDLRADTYELKNPQHSDQGSRYTYEDIMNGLPDSSMNLFDWSGVYTTINYCNKVLMHGEEVLGRDKQFTTSEWKQIKAEMTALRAMNYFYLIRTFKDVPYVNKLVNSDKDVNSYPSTNQMEILNSLISDVESIKGQARNRYSNIKDTKGLITNSAIYALLADMYLWRAALKEGREIEGFDEDNQKCVTYCDEAMTSLKNQNKLNDASGMGSGSILGQDDETDEYGLLQNDFALLEAPEITAYDNIFLFKNSRESIFEMQYSSSDQRKNGFVNSLWGDANGSHLAVNYKAVSASYPTNTEETFKKDSRTWYSCAQSVQEKAGAEIKTLSSNLPCYKYYDFLLLTEENTKRPVYLYSPSTNDYNNWIIYRLSDVLLMKAEALACLEQTEEAKEIITAIYKRSYRPSSGEDISKVTVPKVDQKGGGDNQYVVSVLAQRHIELLAEGKRWFDLVRYAERIGGGADQDPREKAYMNGSDGVIAMVDQFLANKDSKKAQTWKNRLKNRWGLYSPIYYKELSASNGLLLQNPNWNRDKSQN